MEQMPYTRASLEGRSTHDSHGSHIEVDRTRETAHELLNAFSSLQGFKKADNPRALLTELGAEKLVVRREDPAKLLALAVRGEPLEIGFTGATPYANSVEWNPAIDGTHGIDNAYLEGYGHKDHVVTVFGFEKPEGFFLEELDDSQRQFAGVDRTRVRAAAGFVPLESVQFVSVRIPISAMDTNDLTEGEKDLLYEFETADSKQRKPIFIYRTFIRGVEAPSMH